MATTDDEILEVACLAFPDGSSFWLELPEPDERHGAIARCWEGWRAQVPAERRELLLGGDCLGGFVLVRMPRREYQAIPATSHSAAISRYGTH